MIAQTEIRYQSSGFLGSDDTLTDEQYRKLYTLHHDVWTITILETGETQCQYRDIPHFVTGRDYLLTLPAGMPLDPDAPVADPTPAPLAEIAQTVALHDDTREREIMQAAMTMLTDGAFRLYNGLTVGHPRRRQWLTGYRNGQNERASTEISEKNKAHFVTALAAMMRVYARNGWEAPQHDTPDDLYHRAGRFFGLVSTLDTERCPGFFSPQAGATLDCENFKTTRAEYCDECQKAINREEQHEMAMAHLDQWGR